MGALGSFRISFFPFRHFIQVCLLFIGIFGMYISCPRRAWFLLTGFLGGRVWMNHGTARDRINVVSPHGSGSSSSRIGCTRRTKGGVTFSRRLGRRPFTSQCCEPEAVLAVYAAGCTIRRGKIGFFVYEFVHPSQLSHVFLLLLLINFHKTQ